MPKTTPTGKPKQSELPGHSGVRRRKRSGSSQRHDRAAEQYGEGERAHRTAYASLKHNFEKVGDHWEAKDDPGPSDPRSKKSTEQKQRGQGETFGGVDAEGNTKQELYDRAKRLQIEGRSKMDKKELARATRRHSDTRGRSSGFGSYAQRGFMWQSIPARRRKN